MSTLGRTPVFDRLPGSFGEFNRFLDESENLGPVELSFYEPEEAPRPRFKLPTQRFMLKYLFAYWKLQARRRMERGDMAEKVLAIQEHAFLRQVLVRWFQEANRPCPTVGFVHVDPQVRLEAVDSVVKRIIGDRRSMFSHVVFVHWKFYAKSRVLMIQRQAEKCASITEDRFRRGLTLTFHNWLRLLDDARMGKAAARIKSDSERLIVTRYKLDKEQSHSDRIIDLLSGVLAASESRNLLSKSFYHWLWKKLKLDPSCVPRSREDEIDDTVKVRDVRQEDLSKIMKETGIPVISSKNKLEQLFEAPPWPSPLDIVPRATTGELLPPINTGYHIEGSEDDAIISVSQNIKSVRRSAPTKIMESLEPETPVLHEPVVNKIPSQSIFLSKTEESASPPQEGFEGVKKRPVTLPDDAQTTSKPIFVKSSLHHQTTPTTDKPEPSFQGNEAGNRPPGVQRKITRRISTIFGDALLKEVDKPKPPQPPSSPSSSSSSSESEHLPIFKLSLGFYIKMRGVVRKWANRARETVAKRRHEGAVSSAVDKAMQAWRPEGVPPEVTQGLPLVEAMRIFREGAVLMKRKGAVEKVDVKDKLFAGLGDQQRYFVGRIDDPVKFLAYYVSKDAAQTEGASPRGWFGLEEVKLAKFSWRLKEIGIFTPETGLKKISKIPEPFFKALVLCVRHALGVQVRRNSGLSEMMEESANTLKYLFDTLGFVVIKKVLNPEELQRVNASIDARKGSEFFERADSLRNSSRGLSGRQDCGSFMNWPKEDGGEIFRSLLCHPKLHGPITLLCGEGYRLDHKPVLFIQQPNAEGFDLHGGAVNSHGRYNFPISYHCHAGDIVCNLINVAVQLTASPERAGGFQVIPGSHKSNFPPPASIEALHALADDFAYQPVCEAGDVIIFAEAVLHGAAVRTAPFERRVALIRFSPATCAYARGYLDQEEYPLFDSAQKAVATPPYHVDQDRSVPDKHGNVGVPHPRRQDKKMFDRIVFGNDYY